MSDSHPKRGMLRFMMNWLLPPALVLAAGAVSISATWIHSLAGDNIYDLADAPNSPVAIVLGAQVSEDGKPLPFLAGRLDAAIALYRTGKVTAILVSGNRHSVSGDEPTAMLEYLLANGVPREIIAVDSKSETTRDSCIRAVDVYGLSQALVVSQGFHLPRSVALCRAAGLLASGVRAECSCSAPSKAKNLVREWMLAQPKAALELALNREKRSSDTPSVAVSQILDRSAN